MQDRFIRGFIAGLIAWLPTGVVNWGAYYLHFSTLRWSDFTGILVYGHKPHTLPENLFALGGTMFFVSLLGTGFAYLVTQIKSRNCIFKGWVYGVGMWFMFYAVTVLFKVPGLLIIPLKTAFMNFIAASVWGISVALAIIWMDKRIKV